MHVTLQLCSINKNWPINVHSILVTKLHRIEHYSIRKRSCATVRVARHTCDLVVRQSCVIKLEFRQDLWHQKTRVTWLLSGIVCMILGLVILVELQLWWTDRQMDTQTQHTGYIALAWRHRVKTKNITLTKCETSHKPRTLDVCFLARAASSGECLRGEGLVWLIGAVVCGQFAYCLVISPTGHFAYWSFRLRDNFVL